MSLTALLLLVVGAILVVFGLVSLLGGHLIWGLVWLVVGVVVLSLGRGSRLRL